VFFDLLAAIREVVSDVVVDPDDIGDAFLDRSPLDAESGGELVAEVRFVEVPGGRGVQVQPPGIEGPPGTVGTFGHVRDAHVRVKMRVTSAAGTVPECGGDEPAHLDLVDPVLARTGPGRLAFDVRERRVDRCLA